MSQRDNVLNRRTLEADMKRDGRLPPGQSATLDFPVLHYGGIPLFNEATWDLRVFGEVETPMKWSWQEFLALPTVKIKCDIHCVTRWSKFDTEWEGVLFRDFIKLFGVKSSAKHVIAHCDGSGAYTTNTALDIMNDDDVMLAYKFNGQFLDAEHGYPLRTLVPKRYLWKSAKWVRALEFSTTDKPGFWEVNGYHNEGEPFKEERYSRRGFLW
ncbi:MAG: sulfite oxidase-like oxidoreductase [Chloroflexota bacterium]|nr:sulfite oxidase-like oxidoreductase [Chloroflexota bacterium]